MAEVHPGLLPDSNPNQAIIRFRDTDESNDDGKIMATVTYSWMKGGSLELIDNHALIPKDNLMAGDLTEHQRRRRNGQLSLHAEDLGPDRFLDVLDHAELDMNFYEQGGTTPLVNMPTSDDED